MPELSSPHALVDERDPHQDLLKDAPKSCPHGHDLNCECQLPWYEGLFVWPLVGEDDLERHIIAHMKQSHGGGMREFIDPVTGETIGCCGMEFAFQYVKTVDEFAAFYRDPS
jgi:hypothetical protein